MNIEKVLCSVEPYCVYSCTFDNYDYTFGPLVHTPATEFLRFGDWQPDYSSRWQHRHVPEKLKGLNAPLINRYLKFHPRLVAPGADVCVYVDGNIMIKTDLRPLIEEFVESRCDIALFPHPSGRTVEEEMDFAQTVGRIGRDHAHRLTLQRERYAKSGTLSHPVTENSIIFYNMRSEKLDSISETWWYELTSYTHRDQVSLPHVLQKVQPRVKPWTWHFKDPENPYFLRHAHKHGSHFDIAKRKAYVLKDFSTLYAAKFLMLRLIGRARRAFA